MKIGVIVISLIFFTSVALYAQVRQEAAVGTIKAVNCRDGEVKLAALLGDELLFHLGKDVRYEAVSSCDEIKEGAMAVVRYKEEDGKKVVSLIKIRQRTEAKR